LERRTLMSVVICRVFVLALSMTCAVITLYAETTGREAELSGPYFGQNPPGPTPEIFAPGTVSTEHREFGISWSSDGSEFFFTRMEQGTKKQMIMHAAQLEGVWAPPVVASFSGRHPDMEPCLTLDGRTLYFVSFRPVPGSEGFTADIWASDKGDGRWSDARHLGAPFNPGRAMYFSFTKQGAVFTTDARNRGGILRAKRIDGAYSEFERLGPPFDSGDEAHPFVAADGSFLIFDSAGDEGRGLYVSFRTADGGWGRPKSMRSYTGEGGIASLSPDGKHLFFTLDGDIYWVSADIIKRLAASVEP
jgi:hypothetical protein